MANLLFNALNSATPGNLEIYDDGDFGHKSDTFPQIVVTDADSPDCYTSIGYGQIPGNLSMWKFPELRKISLTGATQTWIIGFQKTGPETGFMTRWYGQLGGKIQTIKKEVVLNKSGRDITNQGFQEVKQEYTLKIRSGYVAPCSGNMPNITVMRAHDYTENSKIKFPVCVDTKLDGIRMWVRGTGDGQYIEGFSRGNCKFPHVEHLLEECSKIMSYLPPGAALDGEIFHKDYTFQQITSIVKSVNVKHPEMHNMEYHVFDVYWEENPPFEVRRNILTRALADYRSEKFQIEFQQDYYGQGDYKNWHPFTKIYETKLWQTNSREEVTTIYKYILSIGFEGVMVRKLANGSLVGTADYKSSQYLFGKGTRILKLKPFKTEEAKVLAIEDAKGKTQGCAKLRIQDIRGNIFSITLGTHDERRHWMQNPSLIIGKTITFKYQNLTDAGVPRFPTGVSVRDYEPGYDAYNEGVQETSHPVVILEE